MLTELETKNIENSLAFDWWRCLEDKDRVRLQEKYGYPKNSESYKPEEYLVIASNEFILAKKELKFILLKESESSESFYPSCFVFYYSDELSYDTSEWFSKLIDTYQFLRFFRDTNQEEGFFLANQYKGFDIDYRRTYNLDVNSIGHFISDSTKNIKELEDKKKFYEEVKLKIENINLEQ